jgi:succinylornithine aminotransferase
MNDLTVTRQTFDEVMVPVFSPAAFVPDRGLGSRVWDTQGRDYIDFAGGIAVTALGHAHPELLKVLGEQGSKLWHIGNGYTNEPVLRLAKRLEALTFADRAFFANSGAEANEAALKLARRSPSTVTASRRTKSSRSRSRSTAARSLPSASAASRSTRKASARCRKASSSSVQRHRSRPQGDRRKNLCGDRRADPGRRRRDPGGSGVSEALREACDQHGALLIFDEVQTGVGRSGTFYAYEDTGVTPDILTTAKALGNGFPIGAMLTTNELAAHFKVGVHGTTYGGNPLGRGDRGQGGRTDQRPEAARRRAFAQRALKGHLAKLDERFGIFKEVRGKGLLIGAELNDAFKGRAKDVVTAAGKHGVIMLMAGPNVLRFAPSLIMPLDDLSEGFARLAKAIEAVSRRTS